MVFLGGLLQSNGVLLFCEMKAEEEEAENVPEGTFYLTQNRDTARLSSVTEL